MKNEIEKLAMYDVLCEKYINVIDNKTELSLKEQKLKCKDFVKTILSHYINKNVLPELYEEEISKTYDNLEETFKNIFD